MIFNKVWNYKLDDGRTVRVENYAKFSLKNSTGEVIKVDDEVIYESHRSFREEVSLCSIKGRGYYIDQEKDISLSNDMPLKLTVKMGSHYGWLLRCHISINDALVGGDVDKQIYIPSFLFSFINTFFFVGGAYFWVIAIILVSYTESREYKIKQKIYSNSKELWRKEVSRYFHNEDDTLLLKAEKLNEWSRKCEEKSDYHCRLASYILLLDRRSKDALVYEMMACKNKLTPSCYSALINPSLSQSNKSFSYIVNVLEGSCLSDKEKTMREKKVCSFFAPRHYKIVGDLGVYKKILTPLCKENIRDSCEDLKREL